MPSACCARAQGRGECATVLVTNFRNNSPGGDETFDVTGFYPNCFHSLRKQSFMDGYRRHFRGVVGRGPFATPASTDHASVES